MASILVDYGLTSGVGHGALSIVRITLTPTIVTKAISATTAHNHPHMIGTIMTDTIARSARPVWAVTAWVDDNFVFVELPTTDAPNYIMKFDLTEAGLSKALKLMRDTHRKAQPTGGYYKLPDQPIVRKVAKPSQFTDDQRAKARATLKRLGKI